MADRSVNVRLRLVADEFKRGAQEARSATDQIGGSGAKAGKEVEGGMSRAQRATSAVAESAKATASAVNTIAVGSLVGLGTAAVAVGASYNTMQQTARAALGTLMGSAEAASAQMDKLDEFASNSPFAKDVFIKAQQQLIGFGVEAEKVVPYLDAIQNSVAAVGGSGQDITEVVQIVARIRAGASLGQEDLNQLSERGINAAELIANQMGITEEEFRQGIFGSPLRGAEALAGLDAMVAGMSEKFGGATDAIKEQMVGATDRIKAAFRDIGATIVEPFISANGGGLAVDWANGLADAMRALQGQLGPVVELAGERFGPAFDQVDDILRRIATRIEQVDLEDFGTAVSTLSPVIAGLGAASVTAAAGTLPFLDRLMGGITPLPAAIAAVVASSPEMRALFFDLLEALQPLVPVLGDFVIQMSGTLATTLEAVATALEPLVLGVGYLAEGFAQLPGPLQTIVISLGAIALLNGPLGAFSTTMGKIPDKIRGLPASIGGVTGSMQGLRGAASNVVSFFGGPWGIALGAAATGIALFAQDQRETTAFVKTLTETLDEQTGALTANSREAVINKLLDEGILAEAEALGVNLTLVTNAALGADGAMDALRAALVNTRPELDSNFAATEAGTQIVSDHDARVRAFIGTVEDETGAVQRTIRERELADAARGRSAAAIAAEEEALERNRVALENVAGALELTGQVTDQLAEIAERTYDPVAHLAEQLGGAGEEAEKAAEAMLGSWAEAFDSFIDPLGSYEEALSQKNEAERASAEATAAATEDAEDSWEDYYSEQHLNLAEWADALEKQVEAQENWARNMVELATTAPQAVRDYFAQAGPEGAQALQTYLEGTPEDQARFNASMERLGAGYGQSYADGLAGVADLFPLIAEEKGQEFADRLLEQLLSGEIELETVMNRYGDLLAVPDVEVDVDVDPSGAQMGAEEATAAIQGVYGSTVTLAAEPEPVVEGAAEAQRAIRGVYGKTVTLDLDPGPVEQDAGWFQSIVDGITGTTVDILANADPLDVAVERSQIGINSVRGTTVDIDGDPTPAEIAAQEAQDAVNGVYGTTVTIDGNERPAIDAAESASRNVNRVKQDKAILIAAQNNPAVRAAWEADDEINGIRQRSATVLRADRSPAMETVGGLMESINNRQGTVTVDANVSRVESAISAVFDVTRTIKTAWGGGGSGGMGGGPPMPGGSGARVMRPGSYRVGRGSAAHGYKAVDLPAPIGTPVYAPWPGLMSQTNLGNRSYGRYLQVRGQQGTFLGAHLSSYVGGPRFVRAGELIGRVGSTGNSTGPHLHAEVRRGGGRVEPRGILKYANGGYRENHVAQIAKGGEMRLWAEPETEGEAYIPLAASKRPGAMEVMHKVADDFGMHLVPHMKAYAAGGFVGAPPVSVPAAGVGAPQIDYNQLAEAMARVQIRTSVQVDKREIASASSAGQMVLERQR